MAGIAYSNGADGAGGGVMSIAVGGTGAPSGADVFAVTVYDGVGTAAPTSMTDSKSQTYTKIADTGLSSRDLGVAIWRCHNSVALASTDTITATGGATTFTWQVWVGSGLAAGLSSTAGTTTGGTVSANQVVSVSSGTAAAAGDYIFAAFAADNGHVLLTAESGWTNHFTDSNYRNTLGETNTAGSSGAQTAQATVATTNTDVAAAVVTIAPTAAASTHVGPFTGQLAAVADITAEWLSTSAYRILKRRRILR